MIGRLKSAFSQGLYQTSTTKMEELGTLQILSDGRKFRYVKAGSGGIAAGKLGLAPAATANHINKAVGAVVAVGETSLSLTVGATAVTADQYAGGFLQVNDATGEGHQYKVISNTACDASGTTQIQLEDPIAVALAATSEVSLIPSKFNGVVHSATEEALPVGVPVVAIAEDAYGWVQTSGVACCLITGTPAVGTMVTAGSTAGSLAAMNSTLDIDVPIVGIMGFTAGVTTEYKPVDLRLE